MGYDYEDYRGYGDYEDYEEQDCGHNDDINELQFLDTLMNTNPREVEKCMKNLEWVVKGLKQVYETAEKNGFDPFIEVEYSDVLSLYEKLSDMLLLYHDCVTLHREGKLISNSYGVALPTNIGCANINEHAPAYKHTIDNEKIYTLWKKNWSINKIAKQVGCSPDTVKHRILKIQHNRKND